ncbi:hypothetical protein llap_15404 [Limosa lapponica baueri]|uniref:Akirin-2 n=1 Tax=Limosa lapponica baueri TaxID=1758121 RepID=A0A2I0TKJ8_LIMLA|nr:hypothetical protein llap_15404 [Limosa lapponica baueri]
MSTGAHGAAGSRQLPFGPDVGRLQKQQDDWNDLLAGTSSAASSPLKKEQPLFTLRQVGMICERLLKEREEKIREEYEEILTTKLAEQYDAFVKFTHDQIMRRYGEQPASCGTFAVYE